MTRRDPGFTLLEILVALVILGFIIAGLSGGVQLGLRAWTSQSRTIDAHDELDAVDRALRAMIARIEPGDPTHAAGLAGTLHELALITTLPAAAGPGPDQVTLLVDAQHRLVLRWSPILPGKRLDRPPPPQTIPLLAGVASLGLGYWPAAGGGWRPAWDSLDPPAFVRLRLTFEDARHWPDIIAAPARARLRS